MRNKLSIAVFGIVIFGLILRIVPTFGNNFYFTMDIANEATKAREIIFFRLEPLVGQETSIPGFYHGPLWLYYISIGFVLFNFHPFGSLFMLFLLNAGATAILVWVVTKKISLKAAIIVGLSLQFFWPYFDSTRFAFSPFPLVPLAIVDIILLSEALDGNVRAFIVAAIVSSLPSHLEVASLPPFIGVFLLIATLLLFKKRIKIKHFLLGILALVLVHSARIVSEILSDFSQLHAIQENASSKHSFFSTTQFVNFFEKMITIISEGLIPQSMFLSTILVVLSMIFVMRKKKMNSFVKRFYLLSLLLTFLTFLWFSSNIGWHPWHTVYVAPLIFVSLILVLLSFKNKFGVAVYLFLIIAQTPIFFRNYAYNFRPTNDASILANELGAIDWTYKESQGRGFYVYSYLPSVYDYPYQYLYWWRGTQRYKYMPCEYTAYPNIPDFFISNYKIYQQPQKLCDNIRYLIIEPDKNTVMQSLWLEGARKNTTLEKVANFGDIKVEKRRINL